MTAITPSITKMAYKSVTFTGAAGFGGDATALQLFTRTGAVHIVSLDAVVTVTVALQAGTGTPLLSLGTTTKLTQFIADTTATALTQTAEIWIDATPDADAIAQLAAQQDIIINENIILKPTIPGTALINAGTIEFRVVWYPITTGANLVAA